MPQTLYPRGTLKKIIKAHANRPLSKNVDILVRYPHHQPTRTLKPLAKTHLFTLTQIHRSRCSICLRHELYFLLLLLLLLMLFEF
jgi:hypothetical protein